MIPGLLVVQLIGLLLARTDYARRTLDDIAHMSAVDIPTETVDPAFRTIV